MNENNIVSGIIAIIDDNNTTIYLSAKWILQHIQLLINKCIFIRYKNSCY